MRVTHFVQVAPGITNSASLANYSSGFGSGRAVSAAVGVGIRPGPLRHVLVDDVPDGPVPLGTSGPQVEREGYAREEDPDDDPGNQVEEQGVGRFPGCGR